MCRIEENGKLDIPTPSSSISTSDDRVVCFEKHVGLMKCLLRMLTVHCDQSNSYEITINGFQVRKINEI